MMCAWMLIVLRIDTFRSGTGFGLLLAGGRITPETVQQMRS